MVGKSFVGEGGQNPIEPAKLGQRHPARARMSPISPTSMRCSTKRAARRWRATPKNSRRCSPRCSPIRRGLQGDGAGRRQGGGGAGRRGRSRDAGARAVSAGGEPAGGGVIAPRLLGARAPEPRGARARARSARSTAWRRRGAWRGPARASTPPSSASAISSSAAPARRRPRSPWRACCRAAGERVAFLSRGYGGRRARGTDAGRRRDRTARARSATSRCCWRASRRASSGRTASRRRARRSRTARARWCSTTACRTRRSPRISLSP